MKLGSKKRVDPPLPEPPALTEEQLALWRLEAMVAVRQQMEFARLAIAPKAAADHQAAAAFFARFT